MVGLVPALAALTCVAPQDGGKPFDVQVNEAIERGVAWLRSRQDKATGSFDGEYFGKADRYPGGETALAALTLLKSGVAASDPAVRRAHESLKTLETKKVYTLALRLMFLDALHQPERVREEAERLLAKLIEARDDNSKMWPYAKNEGAPDLSNSQYALLGVRAASHVGIPAPEAPLLETLARLEAFHERAPGSTAKAGGAVYRPGDVPRGSMTVASLTMSAVIEELVKGSARGRQELAKVKELRAQDVKWLERHYSVHNGEGGGWIDYEPYYYLYGVERFCDLTGVAQVAGHDWYVEGARWLLEQQDEKGAWGHPKEWWRRLDSTCFALLFLRRATLTGPAPEIAKDPKGAAQAASRPKPVMASASVPFVENWLVAGPFPNHDDEDFERKPFPIDETAASPSAAEIAFKNRKWLLAGTTDGTLDLNAALRPENGVFGYAFVYVFAEEPADALLWITSDDGHRALWNGAVVSAEHRHGGMREEPDVVPVPIHVEAGKNRLLVAVENKVGDWRLRARIGDRAGQEIPRLRFATAAETRKKASR